jgi:DNA-binding NtrC family response regulator
LQKANFLIWDSCGHNTSQQLQSIIASAVNCDIEVVEGTQQHCDFSNFRTPDLFFWVIDRASTSGLFSESFPGVPKIIVQCSQGSESPVLDSYIAEADDFLVAPLRQFEVVHRVNRLVSVQEKESALKNIRGKITKSQFVGQDPAFLEEISKIPRLADCDATILISGETGVGKEMFARQIHYLSKRSSRHFISVNCGAIPTNLLENELFGHRKGAFTDAQSNQDGIIAKAEGGTLFLDEIDALPMDAQTKLLHLLQDKTFRPLGQAKELHADIRMIAATNADLFQKVQDGLFREDLYYRLTLNICLPALRERSSDIPLLVDYFLKKFSKDSDYGNKSFCRAALQKLLLHAWPGNIRELENIIQEAILLSPRPLILPDDINFRNSKSNTASDDMSFSDAKAIVVEKFERKYITQMLMANKGNVSRAAIEAGKDRSEFIRLMKKFNIDRRAFIVSRS